MQKYSTGQQAAMKRETVNILMTWLFTFHSISWIAAYFLHIHVIIWQIVSDFVEIVNNLHISAWCPSLTMNEFHFTRIGLALFSANYHRTTPSNSFFSIRLHYGYSQGHRNLTEETYHSELGKQLSWPWSCWCDAQRSMLKVWWAKEYRRSNICPLIAIGLFNFAKTLNTISPITRC